MAKEKKNTTLVGLLIMNGGGEGKKHKRNL